jgi:2-methylisocitrate lyase-like PEP mutase family enzyme
MERGAQVSKAQAFLELHHGPRILVLPNAWDAWSARIFEAAGFPALGTTSAGVAWAFGYADGERISRDEMLDAVGRIVRAVSVPVTADMEACYSGTAAGVADTVRGVIAAGAVGLNFEDGIRGAQRAIADLAPQVEKIRALREAATSAGVPLVLNARTDVYLAQVGEPSERFRLAVGRANAYRAAGADCLFVPGVRDRETIAGLVREITGPVNILAGPGLPPIAELEQLGVARLSLGSSAARATMKSLQGFARSLHEGDIRPILGEGTPSHADMNRLFEG